MNRVLVLTLGLAARAISVVASFASDWLFNCLMDGEHVGIYLLRDLCELGEWLILSLARYMVGDRHANAMFW